MWARKRIDIDWLDLLSAVVNCFLNSSRIAASGLAEAAWETDDRALPCLSVRTGFDMVLTALQLPAGSEVLVSAITIPDMVRIIEHHGLVPVPIDLHASDMSPQLELMERSLTSRTKAVLVAHLIGGRYDLTPFAEFARVNGLLLFEDCAQGFTGDTYHGHHRADVSMFSFGPIKTATALGGAILRVKNRLLLHQLREMHAKYPVQSRCYFLFRVLFYCLLKWLGGRIVFRMFFQACRALGKDIDKVLNDSIRNFPQNEFFQNLRVQPSMPQLRLVARRISWYKADQVNQRAALGQLLVSLLPQGCCPGSDANPHTFWVFPVQVPDPDAAIAALHAAGFDSTKSNSMRPVEPPADRPELDPRIARGLLENIVYLPVYAGMPESEIRRMASVLSPLLIPTDEAAVTSVD
jgi:dTDP-4-amino-4,6-dideoxygalactose transaminase